MKNSCATGYTGRKDEAVKRLVDRLKLLVFGGRKDYRSGIRDWMEKEGWEPAEEDPDNPFISGGQGADGETAA